MGTETKYPFEKILRISNAVALVGDNSLLEGTIAYRLGRLGDYTNAPAKHYNKLREAKRKEILAKQDDWKKKKIGATEAQKAEFDVEVAKLDDEFNDALQGLLDQEEEIKVPSFKLSDFLAKEEKKNFETVGKGEDQRKVEIIIKPGQALVPVRFFQLMGDIIVDDKDALK
jgi:hypothetical protein